MRTWLLIPAFLVTLDLPAREFADAVWQNGVLYTVDREFSRAEALNTDSKFIHALADVSRQAMGSS